MLRKSMWLSTGLCVSCLIMCGLGAIAHAQSVGERSARELIKQRQVQHARQTLERNMAQLAQIEQLINDHEKRVEAYAEQLQSENISEISYPEILMQLQVQRINLSIEKAGLDAKAEMLAHLVNSPREEKSDSRALAKRQKLQELLELEQQAHAKSLEMHARGVGSTSEVAESRKRVIQIELQLLEVDEPQQTSGPEAIWAADLSSKVAMERIEVSAKLSKIDELLHPMQQARPQLNSLQRMNKELEVFRNQRTQYLDRQLELSDRLVELEGESDGPLSSNEDQ
ncbi:MAG: hypothetical protein JNK57_14985 [Planctomycetaceae bacterium]|nr:hypothetical protein [Planctomycetaceae bacterium]